MLIELRVCLVDEGFLLECAKSRNFMLDRSEPLDSWRRTRLAASFCLFGRLLVHVLNMGQLGSNSIASLSNR
jgi:hypothetical protein